VELSTEALHLLLVGTRSSRITRREMRELIRMRFLERRTVGYAGDVGLARGPIAESAEFPDAQDIRHQQIRDGEAIAGQPFALAQNIFEMAEAAFHPAGKTIVLRA